MGGKKHERGYYFMAEEKDNQVNAGGELLEKEVMRISLFDSEDSEKMEVEYQIKGGVHKSNALEAIAVFLAEEFDMVPTPKNLSCGIIVCGGRKEDFEKFVSSMKDEEDGNSGEGKNTDAKGEDNE